MIIIVVALVAGSSFSISSAETMENQPKRDFNQLPELIENLPALVTVLSNKMDCCLLRRKNTAFV